jgi:oligopeptide/dipeptide ABC transporter ATP-binding protein
LFISHGLPLIRVISTRVAVMYLGRIVEIGPTDALFDRPAHPYTLLLRESTPRITPSASRTAKFPQLPQQTSGCRFRNRCPLAAARCAEEVPELREIEAGHFAACHFAERVQEI